MKKGLIACAVLLLGVTASCNALATPDRGIVSPEPELRCGSYCLYMALKLIPGPTPSFAALEKSLGEPGPDGYSMQQLAEAARKFGIHCVGFQSSLDEIREHDRPFACIALLKKGHFVIVWDVDDETVSIVDPPRNLSISRDGFNALWTGKALILADHPIGAVRSHSTRLVWITSGVLLIGMAWLAVNVVWRRIAIRRAVKVLTLAVAFLILSGCHGKSSVNHEGPRLSVEPRSIDLGRVSVSLQGTVRCGLLLRNTGARVLRIQSVHSSCGCTLVSAPKTAIIPSESAEVRVEVKTGFEPGPRASKIVVLSDDPRNPSGEIPVRWEAISKIAVEPLALNFGRIKSGTTRDQTMRVWFEEPNSEKSVRIVNDSPQLTATWATMKEDIDVNNRVRELKVTVTGEDTVGDRRSYLMLRGDEPDQIVSIPVQWSVVADYSYAPAAIYSARHQAGEAVTAEFLINAESGESFRINDIAIDGHDAKDWAEIIELGVARRKIKMTTSAPEKPGSVRHLITLSVTGGHGDDKITVPWTIVVEP